MQSPNIITILECNPVIAAIQDDKWEQVLNSPAEVIFYLSANILTVKEKVHQAHLSGKSIIVHLDLAEGIGKDRAGIHFLAQCGIDGIISTKSQLIRLAKAQGLLTIQRFFALDSKGIDSIDEMLQATNPHLIEIMPGTVGKVIRRFSKSKFPVIAGGLIQTKSELTEALSAGALAVSTGQVELWNM